MRTSRKIASAVVGVAMAGAAAVAVPAFAAQPTPGGTPIPAATATPSVPKDGAGGLKTSLDTLVRNATITQAQADKIRTQSQTDRAARRGEGDGPGDHGRHGGMGRMGMGGNRMGTRGGELLTTAAKTLGLSADVLRTQLQTKSLGEIADAQKVPRATLKAALTKSLSTGLEARVEEMLTMSPGRPGRSRR
ncbi:MAG: hypothetical protein Q4P32_13615 [Micrococcales bacterium]|nr:hypothetical protein [Micrococcales bacterium]